MRQESRLSALVAATAALSAVVGASSACIGGNCSRKDPVAYVSFPASVSPEDVVTFTASGACGPAPALYPGSNCQGSAIFDCGAGTATAWSVSIPAFSAGACMVHVGLADGRIFDGAVTVHYSSDCGGGYFTNESVDVSFNGLDGGEAD